MDFARSLRRLLPPTNLIALLFLTAASPSHAATFQGLGHLPGGETFSTATAISADGSTVVGASQSAAGLEAVRWSRVNGLESLGDLAGGSVNSIANAVSADGSVIVGEGTTKDGYSGHKAFKWTPTGGMVVLSDTAPENGRSAAWGISGDGRVIVGQFSPQSSENGRAAVWIDDAFSVLKKTDGIEIVGISHDASANGAVIAGYSQPNAFRYTEAFGAAFFAQNIQPTGVSSDGSTIVGGVPRAFRWRANEGVVYLSESQSHAYDASSDGRIIVGLVKEGPSVMRACMWVEGMGEFDIQELLRAQGVSTLNGWKLSQAKGVSNDGKSVAGVGTNPNGNTEAWIATFDIPKNAISLSLKGKSRIVTSRRKQVIRGVASAKYGSVSHVTFQIVGQKEKTAKGEKRWRIPLRLKAKRTVVKVRAYVGDEVSAPVVVRIIRR